MFKKKQPRTPARNRPTVTSERQRASVFSYHASRSVSGSDSGGGSRRPENKSQPTAMSERLKPVGRLRRATRMLLFMAVIAAVLLNVVVSTTPKLLVANTAARGQLFLQDEDIYMAAAASILQDSYMRRTKLTFNARAVANELSQQFPELGGVVVSVPFIGQQPVFYIEPAAPALLLASGAKVYVLDISGKALAELAHVPSVAKMNLPTITDQSGLPVTLGKIALPSTNISFVIEVIGQLKAKQLSVRSLALPAGTSELQVQVSGMPYIIKFNLHGDARAEVGAYLAVRQQLAKENKVPASYIDVRVENRAYYR